MPAEPRLPPDLERTIFQLAAHEDPHTTLQIILVAQRCRAWIEPLLYRSVVVCQSSWSLPLFLRTLEANPAHFAKIIKTVQIDPYITLNKPSVTRILSICTGVVHLVDFSYGRTPFSVLSRLRLERMCIGLDVIDGLAEGYLKHAAFAHLTHLQVLDPPQRWPYIPFADLPSLTHLALQNYKIEIRSPNVPILRGILANCKLLEVLVVCIPLCRPEDYKTQATKLLVDDPRLVILSRTLNSSHDLWLRPFEECCTSTAQEMGEIIDVGACQVGADSVWRKKVHIRILRAIRMFDGYSKPTRRARKKRHVNGDSIASKAEDS
ncbi:hypothetical protein DFH07DRAFT_1035599 [Mycena maculata]|uniref:Uncharacterized protein n=1 Tax=Mycena maculata TaxID=230809 RepID=A0AAD7IS26_9AGAR|nr:hypothetical protein DFH07DRAFT_1035599 [Mycena maculata]